jgi:putative transposase
MRDVFDAVLYILRPAGQRRYFSVDFPPKRTVWRYFDEWRHSGTLDVIHDTLRHKVRTAEKPHHPRTTACVDSQSVDTTSGGKQWGRDMRRRWLPVRGSGGTKRRNGSKARLPAG